MLEDAGETKATTPLNLEYNVKLLARAWKSFYQSEQSKLALTSLN